MPSVPWLNLVLAPGLGPARAQQLLEHFDSIDAIVSAHRQDLMAAGVDGANSDRNSQARPAEA